MHGTEIELIIYCLPVLSVAVGSIPCIYGMLSLDKCDVHTDLIIIWYEGYYNFIMADFYPTPVLGYLLTTPLLFIQKI